MIQFENEIVAGFMAAFRGMRNPYESHNRSDSELLELPNGSVQYRIGEKDKELALKLIHGGTEHAKFLRQIVCWADITAPRFWWVEFDTYRYGVEKNSCSTMHTITRKPFQDADFGDAVIPGGVIADLNELRAAYLSTEDVEARRHIWRNIIDRLPQSYMQKRTVMMSYQAIRAMCHQRRGHKLTEWADFIAWAKTLPESWMLLEDGQ